MDTKICTKCKQTLPVAEFYRTSKGSDRTFSQCKECTRQGVRANRRKNAEYYRAFDKARAQTAKRKADNKKRTQTPEYKAWKRLYTKKRRAVEPEKYKARMAVGNAVRDKRLTKLPCQMCGSPKSEAHHEDYTKPLVVEWFCYPCHREHRHGQRPVI